MDSEEEIIDLLLTLTENSAQKDNRGLIQEILSISNLSPSQKHLVEDIISNHVATLKSADPVVIYDSRGQKSMTDLT